MEGNKNTKEIKICRLLRLLSVICWWSSILCFVIHMISCFVDPTQPEFYEGTLIPSAIAYTAVTFIQWLALSVLYFMSGIAVLKTNVKLLRFLAIIGFILQVLVIIYYYKFSGRLLEGGFWGFILLLSWIWLSNIKKESGRNVRFYMMIPLILGFASTCMWSPIYSDHSTVWNHIEAFSFYSQWILRSGAFLFTGLWLMILTYEKDNETIVFKAHNKA